MCSHYTNAAWGSERESNVDESPLGVMHRPVWEAIRGG